MNTTLDETMTDAGAKIEAALARGEVDEANRLTYNLAADLAEGWPGDDRPRERRHLEAGLAAAVRCLAWRRELRKGPKPFAIAHWVHGVHLLSLGRAQDAVAALQRSVEAAVQAAREAGEGADVDARGAYLVIINSGFLGLAQEVARRGSGRALLDAARRAFAEQAERDAALREDAQYGLSNLDTAARRFLPALD